MPRRSVYYENQQQAESRSGQEKTWTDYAEAWHQLLKQSTPMSGIGHPFTYRIE